jgi:hypothetical protein
MTDDLRYPFITKAAIAARLKARETGFVQECMGIMQARHEARLVGRAAHGGWMASQAVNATKLAARFAASNPTKAEVALAAGILGRYVKQIAAHMRERALHENPALAEAAARYGVGAPAAPAPPASPAGLAARPGGEESAEAAAGRGTQESDGEQRRPTEPAAGAQDEQEDETARAVASVLREEPGLRAEELAPRVGMTTAMLAPTLRAMVAAGTLEKEGSGRGTRYSVR